MNLENHTPFTPAFFVSAKQGAGHLATVLVKAAFEIKHRQIVRPLERPVLPIGNTYPEGADPAVSSLVYASDFVPYKVRADVLLTATAYRPADKPAGTFQVAIQVGEWSKQLAVSGRQEFEHGILTSTVIERDPLTSIPVTYENAFGGPQHAANPVGRDLKAGVLPNIEYFDHRLRKSGNVPVPAGFGPIAPDWEPRKSMVGTFGKDYLSKHWPGFPGDFDERYFNAAPADQQIDGFLRGDEHVILENLHPQHALFATRLPGLRVICLRENEDATCELVPLEIDTLWINPDEEKLVLLWRGKTLVQSPDALEVKRLGFLVESLAKALGDAAHYRAQLKSLIDKRDAELEPEEPPAQAEPDGSLTAAGETPETAAPTEDADDAFDRDVEAQIAAMRAQAGHLSDEGAPPTEPPPLSPEAQVKFDEIMADIENEDRQRETEEEAKKWTREKVIAAVKLQQSLADADLCNLDLSDCDFTAADFRGAKLNGVALSRAQLTRAVFAGCSIEGAKFDSATLDEAILAGANCRGATFLKTSVVGANLVRADLTKAVLTGANLSAIAAERAVFEGASLADAVLTKATLIGAVLSGVQAAKANFHAADLSGAIGDRADFHGAMLKHAKLNSVIFTASNLEGANLDGVDAADADFTEAQLTGASFRSANCNGMWLSSAKADAADFQGADCTDLQVDATAAANANFAGCTIAGFRGSQGADLSGANFRGARGVAPIFESCRVDGADFSLTDIPGASFIHASATRTTFTAAELGGARFDYADCRNSTFATANLLEANFAGADLSEADISDGNLFRAEFLDARITGLSVSRCNLNSTKLEHWAATRTK